jgi:hypothetical protein
MRDPDRIEPFLNELKKLWLDNYDLRFWQLLSILKVKEDMFHVEDDWTLNKIKEFTKKEENK